MNKVIIKNVKIYPFMGRWRMTGNVYGHPRFDDGTEVTTSRIEEIKTRNTEYIIEEEAEE